MPSGRPTLDVGIIGCGTAGGAAALFLSRAGHRVTLYERVSDLGPVGAGIVLQPTGQAVLRRLGLLEDILRRGARIDQLRSETPTHRTVLDLSYSALEPDIFGLGLHRGVLFDSLYQAVKKSPVKVELGCDIERLDRREDGAVWVVDDIGRRHGPHELVIVADGARSRLREGTDLRRHVSRYPWGALWFVGFDPEQRFKGRLFQVLDGTRKMVGLLPTGLGPPSMRQIPLVSLFWSIREDEVDDWHDAGIDVWKREVLRYVPRANMVLDQIVSAEQMTWASYYDVRMYPWHTEGVVYLGDAAHAMSPQLGQGCNLALYDAMVLAECIEAIPELPLALEAYSHQRRRHLYFYQLATRWLTPVFQSELVPLGWMRDLLMGPMCRVPPLARQMIASMAGVKTGVVSRSLPLRDLPPPAALPPASRVG